MLSALLLAAGRSTRFGGHKLLAPLDGEPLVRHAAANLVAAALDEVVVVVGHEGAAVRSALDGLPVRVVVNAEHARGMSASLAAGVRALAPAAEAVLVALGDQPGIAPDTITRLVHAWRASGRPVAVPVYDGGVRGHPVLFARAVFGELLSIEGDVGARAVIARDPARVVAVRVDGPAPRDVDTREDHAALARSMPARGG